MTVPSEGAPKRLQPKTPQVQRPMGLAFMASGATYLILELAERWAWVNEGLNLAFGGVADAGDRRAAMTAVLMSLLVGLWAKIRQLRYRQVMNAAEEFIDDVRDLFDGPDDDRSRDA